MYDLPTSLTVNEVQHKIRNNGDFRMVLDCFSAMNDTELTKQERSIATLAIFLDEVHDISDVYNIPDLDVVSKEMIKFFNCGRSEEQQKHQNFKLIDWQLDEALICSAINKVAGKEIRLEPYIHWWTFMGYYTAIGESSLSTIVGIRYKQSTNKKLEKHERQFIQENPQYFNWDRRTTEQKEEDEYIRSIWNSGN